MLPFSWSGSQFARGCCVVSRKDRSRNSKCRRVPSLVWVNAVRPRVGDFCPHITLARFSRPPPYRRMHPFELLVAEVRCKSECIGNSGHEGTKRTGRQPSLPTKGLSISTTRARHGTSPSPLPPNNDLASCINLRSCLITRGRDTTFRLMTSCIFPISQQ